MMTRRMKGSGLLINIFLLLIVYAFSSSTFYSLVSFSQGVPQKMEIYASQAAFEIASAPTLTVSPKVSMLVTPCGDGLVLPQAEVLASSEVLNSIHEACSIQHQIVCVISEKVRDEYFMACRGLIRGPDRTYLLQGGESGTSFGLIEGENRTVIINMEGT